MMRRKEKVQLQELTRKTWQRKWGFLADQERAYKQEAAAANVDHRRVGLRGEPRTLKLVDAVLPSPPIPRLSSGREPSLARPCGRWPRRESYADSPAVSSASSTTSSERSTINWRSICAF